MSTPAVVAGKVEFGDVGAAAGEHDRVVPGDVGGPPFGQQEGLGVVGVVTDRDPAVLK